MTGGELWLTTFCTEEFRWSAEVLRHTALEVGQVDKVKIWTPEDITELSDAHPELYYEGSRGYGFWSWKPWIIRHTLGKMRDGDWLVYCDSAIIVEASIKKFLEQDNLRDEHVILFQLGEAVQKRYTIGNWTKPRVLDELHVRHASNQFQVNAGIMLFKARDDQDNYATYVTSAWQELCLQAGLIDDSGPPAVMEHRHDQALLSLLARSLYCNSRILVDCTQYGREDEDPDHLELRTLVDHHRQRLPPLSTVTVITATTGRPELRQCIESVQAQRLPCVQHLIVVDGPARQEAAQNIIRRFEHKHPIHVIQLPYSVGRDGWNGHRIFGSAPYLCDSDYTAFLDDDNWWEPDHLLNMMRLVNESDCQASFSLRQIHDKAGRFVCNDECESLGNFAPSVLRGDDFFCDTSSMMLRRDLAIALAPLWNSRFRSGEVEADRAFSRAMLQAGFTGGSAGGARGVPKHTLHYRLGGSPGSVQAEFFETGNQRTRYDFSKPIIYLFHFSAKATNDALAALWDDSRCYSYDEWQLSLCKGLRHDYNLMNGFDCQQMIAPESTVLCHLCNPGDVPLQAVFRRDDLRRVCYTLESPNMRHAAQWSLDFLQTHFDVLLTYWKPLLDNPRVKTVPCLHNTHHLDLTNPEDREKGLRQNQGTGRSVCMVLEHRQTHGQYMIDGHELHALDHLRQHFVKDLHNATVFGINWSQASLGPGVKIGHDKHRNLDKSSSVDHMQNFTFALIIENCDAENNLSEKCYDAFSAGSIPLYHDTRNNAELTAVPKNMYINISRFPDSAALQTYLDSLTDDDIQKLRNAIYAQREQVLSRVSVQAYASCVAQGIIA